MNLRLSLLKLLLVLVCVSCHLSPARNSGATDYELELRQINDEISQSSNGLAKTPYDKKTALKRIFFFTIRLH
ncbi:MAG: hypothetical protein KAJ63_01275 [Methyloprofundus sp.]|nr:hypothetical protein [Methyloprofundus sp.]